MCEPNRTTQIKNANTYDGQVVCNFLSSNWTNSRDYLYQKIQKIKKFKHYIHLLQVYEILVIFQRV